MALFRGIPEYIALDANNITLVFDSGNILTSLAIYSCIPLKAIQYYIIILFLLCPCLLHARHQTVLPSCKQGYMYTVCVLKLQPAIFPLSQHVIRFHELPLDTTQRFLQ